MTTTAVPSVSHDSQVLSVVAGGGLDAPVSYAGQAVTLDDVIAEWQGEFQDYMARFEADRAEDREVPLTRREYVREWGDMTVWEGNRVAAVLWPHPDGRPRLMVSKMEQLPARV